MRRMINQKSQDFVEKIQDKMDFNERYNTLEIGTNLDVDGITYVNNLVIDGKVTDTEGDIEPGCVLVTDTEGYFRYYPELVEITFTETESGTYETEETSANIISRLNYYNYYDHQCPIILKNSDTGETLRATGVWCSPYSDGINSMQICAMTVDYAVADEYSL